MSDEKSDEAGGPAKPRGCQRPHVITQSMDGAGILAHLSDLKPHAKGPSTMACSSHDDEEEDIEEDGGDGKRETSSDVDAEEDVEDVGGDGKTEETSSSDDDDDEEEDDEEHGGDGKRRPAGDDNDNDKEEDGDDGQRKPSGHDNDYKAKALLEDIAGDGKRITSVENPR